MLAFTLLLGTLFCLFPAENPWMQYWANHAAWVSLAYLALGLLFFFINRTRLMFVCMGCCAAICFYNQEITPQHPQNIQHLLETRAPVDSQGAPIPAAYEHPQKN